MEPVRDQRNAEFRGQKGASMLEFSLIAPLLMVFIVNVLDLGQALFIHSTLTQIVREGVRQASIQPGLEVGLAQNLQGGCISPCMSNHANVHKRIAQLLSLEEQTSFLRINDDPPSSSPNFAAQRRMIQTERVNTGGGPQITVAMRVNFRAFFPLMDGMNISASHTGPYLQ